MTTYGPYAETVVEIHDGDTIDVDLVLTKAGRQSSDRDLGFNVHRNRQGVTLERQSVRLLGCNAPELATPAGKDALAFIELVSHGWDKYGGRVDGAVTLADGRDLTAVMIAAGHAAPWDGTGPKPLPASPAGAVA